MKQYTAALIGCGTIGIEEKNVAPAVRPGTHAAALHAHPRIQLVGLVDVNTAKQRIAKKYFPAIPFYTTIDDLCAAQTPDIIVIATPPETHAPLTLKAAPFSPRIIISEKPIALSVPDGRRMINACKKK